MAPAARSRVSADEYPFESQWLDVDGHRYHYVDEGQGDVLLFVHGNPTWSFAWRRLIRDLSPQYRCIAVDHVGCGLSDKPQQYAYRLDQHIRNLNRLLDALDLTSVTLVAHDWGGAIGMGAAGRAPERFRRFVLCNTAAFRSQRIPLRIAVCRVPVFGKLMIQGLNAFAGAAVHMAVARRLEPAVRAGYLAPYDSWAHRVATYEFVQDIPLRPSHPSYDTLLEVERNLEQFQGHPVLLLWGARDWCFTTEFLAEFQQRFPDAETEVWPNASHYVFEDAADEMSARLARFLTDYSSS